MNSKHLASGSPFPEPQDGKLRIYSMRYCPFAHRILLVVEAKGISHDIVNINLSDKPQWLLERNPEGKVPTIETPQGPLYDSLILAEYLDETYPNRRLFSSDPFQKALDKIWADKSSSVTNIYYKLASKVDTDPETIANRFKELAQALAPLEAELNRRGTHYFGGSEPGILDYAFWPSMERIPVLNISYPAQDFENDFKSQHPRMEKWRVAMMEDRAVKSFYLSAEIHHKFIESHVAGNPNYELVH